MRPPVALTMGDVAGIGPEVIARAWSDPALHRLCRPAGDRRSRRAPQGARPGRAAGPSSRPSTGRRTPNRRSRPCPASIPSATGRRFPGRRPAGPGRSPRAGRAAYDFLIAAIDLALAGRIDAITTLPLNKESLRLAGIAHPGHTEILAERCGVADHAMMLYLASDAANRRRQSADRGPGWASSMSRLHVALRQVFELLTDGVGAREDPPGRPGDAAADRRPHGRASPSRRSTPTRASTASSATRRSGSSPRPSPQARPRASTSTGRSPTTRCTISALGGEFDAVVAMYHDQGHIALKTAGFRRAVNVTLGLPIVRTSVAHGTAFDIAWQGIADPSSLIEAVRVAARLVAGCQPPNFRVEPVPSSIAARSRPRPTPSRSAPARSSGRRDRSSHVPGRLRGRPAAACRPGRSIASTRTWAIGPTGKVGFAEVRRSPRPVPCPLRMIDPAGKRPGTWSISRNARCARSHGSGVAMAIRGGLRIAISEFRGRKSAWPSGVDPWR